MTEQASAPNETDIRKPVITSAPRCTRDPRCNFAEGHYPAVACELDESITEAEAKRRAKAEAAEWSAREAEPTPES